MKSIENPEDVKCYMIIANIIVIVSPDDTESPFNVIFNPILEQNDEILNLDDIFHQVNNIYKAATILVIAEYPLRGNIYRYGNYEEAGWIEVGTMEGYA